MKRLVMVLLLSAATAAMAGKPFFKSHGLVLFYGSSCPHCQRFAPVIRQYAKAHQVLVLPLSLDNKALPGFQDFLPATTEWLTAAFKDRPIEYPALFIVNPDAKTLYPVSIGALDSFELEARMQALIPRIRAYEDKGGRV